MLELKNLSKVYGDVVAVDDINLTIKKDEFFCLLGPSGCGKTTILRLVAGFESPTSGHILLDGKDISKLPPYKRDVNTVFQNYALFPHLSVFDNIAYGLRIKNVSGDEVRERVIKMLDMVALKGLDDRMPSQLSGGQQQRVALARALVNKPSIILLDEPLSALDEKIRRQMQVELSNIQYEVKVTFIYVTHNQEEALTMGDRVAIMRDASILQLGTPAEIYEKPQSRFVAEFIGSMNIFEGRVVSKNGNSAMIRLCDDEVIEVRRKLEFDEGREILFGIRPESLKLTRENPSDDENCFPGVIENKVYFGEITEYIIKIKTGKNMQVMYQNYFLKESNLIPFSEGDKVNIVWDKTSGQILGAQQG